MCNNNARAYLILTILALSFLASAAAQQKGQYLPGQFGLNAGVMPDPGITYNSMRMNYSADRLNDSNGDQLRVRGEYNVWAVENLFFYSPKAKFLGAKFMAGRLRPLLPMAP